MKTIYVEVAVRIKDEADAHEVISNCDYRFTSEDIICTEIVGVVDENEAQVF